MTPCYYELLQLGEHAEWDKYTNFEIAHRAPMMLHVPGIIEEVGSSVITTDDNCNITICGQAQLSEQLVEFVDILPTLVEAAGLPQLELCPEYSRNVSICRYRALC